MFKPSAPISIPSSPPKEESSSAPKSPGFFFSPKKEKREKQRQIALYGADCFLKNKLMPGTNSDDGFSPR